MRREESPGVDGAFGDGDGVAGEGFGVVGVAHEGGDHGLGLELGEEFAAVVAELFSPFEKLGDGGFEVGAGFDFENGALERFGGAETFGVPRGDAAEEAGFQTVLSIREGNGIIQKPINHNAVASFYDLE